MTSNEVRGDSGQYIRKIRKKVSFVNRIQYITSFFLSIAQANQLPGHLKFYSQKPQQYLGQQIPFVNCEEMQLIGKTILSNVL